MTPPSPSVGDMWKWHTNGRNWTVILISEECEHVWNCLCLEDGEVGWWHFSEAEMPDWEFLA